MKSQEQLRIPVNAAPPAAPRTGPRQALVLVALLVAVCGVVLVVHWPVLAAQARTFDDDSYFADNPLVQNPSWESAGRFLSEVLTPSTVPGYYQPLAMISLMLDYACGARPEHLYPVHCTSLALHVLNTALIAALLYGLFGQPVVAALVGLLFGLHPLAVESVAWLAERKTVLATFFCLWALLGYVSYVRLARRWVYVASVAAFVLALLSKPTTTPLPLLLLLLDFWPLRRLSWRAVWEKWPFFTLAAACAAITVVSQARTASVELPHAQGLARFLLIPCHNIVFYPLRFFWPVNLTSFYPYPEPLSLAHPAVLAGVLGTGVLTLLLGVSLRWTRAALTGGLIFLAAILPSLGVIGFTNTIAALRHLYLPALGFLLAVAALLTYLWRGGGYGRQNAWVRGAVIAVVLLLAACESIATRQLLQPWRNTESLYRHMLHFAPAAGVLHSDLGNELVRQMRYGEAIEHLTRAVNAGGSTGGLACFNLGGALEGLGRKTEAAEQFRLAAAELENQLRGKPGTLAQYHTLAQALARQGRIEEAVPYFERAVRACPSSADLWLDLGNVLAMRGDGRGAVERYEQALRLKPNLFGAQFNLAGVWLELGERERAVGALRAAIRLKPDAALAYRQLGQVLLSQGRAAEAVATYEAGLRYLPNDPELRAELTAAVAQRDARPR
jgi:tetratricopeptide (TPR) repeat protein